MSSALIQLTQYLHRFRNRLKPVHALWIRQTLSVLQGLQKLCEEVLDVAAKGPKPKAEILDTNSLMARLGRGSDQVNLIEMVKYLKKSKLARKVCGFAEKTAEEAALKGKSMITLVLSLMAEHKVSRSTSGRHASIASFHQVEAFLLSLTDARDDGRILLTVEEGAASRQVTLKYILLNPAERFKEVVDEARCVILAGGTMSPVSVRAAPG